MPDGMMEISKLNSALAGYQKYETIVFQYLFAGGIQKVGMLNRPDRSCFHLLRYKCLITNIEARTSLTEYNTSFVISFCFVIRTCGYFFVRLSNQYNVLYQEVCFACLIFRQMQLLSENRQ